MKKMVDLIKLEVLKPIPRDKKERSKFTIRTNTDSDTSFSEDSIKEGIRKVRE